QRPLVVPRQTNPPRHIPTGLRRQEHPVEPPDEIEPHQRPQPHRPALRSQERLPPPSAENIAHQEDRRGRRHKPPVRRNHHRPQRGPVHPPKQDREQRHCQRHPRQQPQPARARAPSRRPAHHARRCVHACPVIMPPSPCSASSSPSTTRPTAWRNSTPNSRPSPPKTSTTPSLSSWTTARP